MSAAVEKKLDEILVLLNHLVKGTKPRIGRPFTPQQLRELNQWHVPAVEDDSDFPTSTTTREQFWKDREPRRGPRR
jgi:hypothetical protein